MAINWREIILGKKVEPVVLKTPIISQTVHRLNWGDYERVLMAVCVWRESRGEGSEAWRWVAWSVRNRLEHKGVWYNRSGFLSEVISLPQQYSSMTVKGDAQLTFFPVPKRLGGAYAADPVFLEILAICEDSLDQPLENDPSHGSTHFYDTSITAPSWARPDKFTGQVGHIRFYREA